MNKNIYIYQINLYCTTEPLWGHMVEKNRKEWTGPFIHTYIHVCMNGLDHSYTHVCVYEWTGPFIHTCMCVRMDWTIHTHMHAFPTEHSDVWTHIWFRPTSIPHVFLYTMHVCKNMNDWMYTVHLFTFDRMDWLGLLYTHACIPYGAFWRWTHIWFRPTSIPHVFLSHLLVWMTECIRFIFSHLTVRLGLLCIHDSKLSCAIP